MTVSSCRMAVSSSRVSVRECGEWLCMSGSLPVGNLWHGCRACIVEHVGMLRTAPRNPEGVYAADSLPKSEIAVFPLACATCIEGFTTNGGIALEVAVA